MPGPNNRTHRSVWTEEMRRRLLVTIIVTANIRLKWSDVKSLMGDNYTEKALQQQWYKHRNSVSMAPGGAAAANPRTASVVLPPSVRTGTAGQPPQKRKAKQLEWDEAIDDEEVIVKTEHVEIKTEPETLSAPPPQAAEKRTRVSTPRPPGFAGFVAHSQPVPHSQPASQSGFTFVSFANFAAGASPPPHKEK